MKWMELILSVLAGLTTAIPLVIQLVKYVQKAIQEKNWPDKCNNQGGFADTCVS